jgi:hypothetical protein
MPVTIQQLIPANAGLPYYAEAQALALATINQFGAVRGVDVGIGPASCCAGFAVAPAAQFPALPGHAFGATFGNSRIAAGQLDEGPVGGHAERCALTAAGNNHLVSAFGGAGAAVLFVELAPCGGCANWLQGGGGGVANPFNFGVGGQTLHVWYAFPYPAGVGAMTAFHNTPLAAQQVVVAGW